MTPETLRFLVVAAHMSKLLKQLQDSPVAQGGMVARECTTAPWPPQEASVQTRTLQCNADQGFR
ncbi:hypothetical protein UB44_15185 [Burkholderiaceae bacterium 26]|nr:hypothetical protein UB44_15185 [Burkholderiaceae bacterium 26]